MYPVSAAELGNFISMVIRAFQEHIFIGFTLMVAFSVAYGIKRIMVEL